MTGKSCSCGYFCHAGVSHTGNQPSSSINDVGFWCYLSGVNESTTIKRDSGDSGNWWACNSISDKNRRHFYLALPQRRITPEDYHPDNTCFVICSADNEFSGGTVKYKTPVILTYNGKCSWFCPASFTSTCPIDVQYFPFDRQKCILKFGSWTYEVNIWNICIQWSSVNLVVVKGDISRN